MFYYSFSLFYFKNFITFFVFLLNFEYFLTLFLSFCCYFYIEFLSGVTGLHHGECVSIGMVYEAMALRAQGQLSNIAVSRA